MYLNMYFSIRLSLILQLIVLITHLKILFFKNERYILDIFKERVNFIDEAF